MLGGNRYFVYIDIQDLKKHQDLKKRQMEIAISYTLRSLKNVRVKSLLHMLYNLRKLLDLKKLYMHK